MRDIQRCGGESSLFAEFEDFGLGCRCGASVEHLFLVSPTRKYGSGQHVNQEHVEMNKILQIYAHF